ncbi:hypothetical protein [Kordia sp.]|uniref:hypothetical protein n=1 Tax=Kordia sp. TaxID=1965332 RepID=UPI003D2A70A0
MSKNQYISSTNIIRDENREVNYIPTRNTNSVARLILDEFNNGTHSFSIIGSYGTGKSSFLWAFNKSLSKNDTTNYFDFPQSDIKFVKTINIVGEYNSLISYFESHFSLKNNLKGNQKIFDALYQEYEVIKKKKGILLICIDEFGKFLEFASKNNPEREMYFIQQLAEFVNDPDRNIILLTTVHQAIDSYSYNLTDVQKNEWAKVKGRLKEITFNEPVEQLLYMASEYFASIYGSKKRNEKYLNKLIQINENHNCFKITNSYLEDIVNKLYPLDLFSAIVLTLSLQRYGQNERSLFSFLQTTDHLGLEELKSDELFDLTKVYDYLLVNLYATLVSKLNPDYASWALIKESIEKAEAKVDTDQNIALDLIKSIGLLNLFSSKGASLDEKLFGNYFSVKYGVKKVKTSLKQLVSLKIIRYNTFNNSYKLYGGTDLDIEQEMLNVSNRVNTEIDVVSKLSEAFSFSVLVAKEFLYKTGTPRLFQFRISELPIKDNPINEIDGFINLIFNENLTDDELISFTKENEEVILYGLYRNTATIKKTLIDIAKTEKVLSEVDTDDKFAIKELKSIRKSQKALLNHYVLDSLYSDKIDWFFNGEKVEFSNKHTFNKFLSEICFKIYQNTPSINMELINKHKVSGSINSARKQYFFRLVNHWQEKDLGYPESKFPADKTIYWSLIKNTGIHRKQDQGYVLTKPNSSDENFNKVWDKCETFLLNAKNEPKQITELINTLKSKPYKLKQGVIDFLIPTFLFTKRGDYALYNVDSGYIPYLDESNLYLITRNPFEYSIKSFELSDLRLTLFNKYRRYLNQNSEDKLSNESFVESIKPFLVLYKSLEPYSQNTKKLSKEALSLKEAIANAKDPEKVFFEQFPQAIGYDVKELVVNEKLFDEYILKFQKTIIEVKDSYAELLTRFEKYITGEILGYKARFPKYKTLLQKRFASIKEHQVLPSQKTFLLRVNSELDDRDSWLNSICFSLISKPFNKISDKDEILLKEKLNFIVKELDNLCEIKNLNFDEATEDIYKIDFTSTSSGLKNHLVRVSKKQKQEIEKNIASLSDNLTDDKQLRIAVLSELLKRELDE